jgi:hypothetical protein
MLKLFVAFHDNKALFNFIFYYASWSITIVGACVQLLAVGVFCHAVVGMWGTVQRPKPAQLKGLRRSEGVTIVRPPGSRLHALAGFFYSPKVMERIFDPMLEDMRSEYFAALANGRIWRARWARLSYYWSFAKVIPLHSFTALGKQLFEIWKLLK